MRFFFQYKTFINTEAMGRDKTNMAGACARARTDNNIIVGGCHNTI